MFRVGRRLVLFLGVLHLDCEFVCVFVGGIGVGLFVVDDVFVCELDHALVHFVYYCYVVCGD